MGREPETEGEQLSHGHLEFLNVFFITARIPCTLAAEMCVCVCVCMCVCVSLKVCVYT